MLPPFSKTAESKNQLIPPLNCQQFVKRAVTRFSRNICNDYLFIKSIDTGHTLVEKEKNAMEGGNGDPYEEQLLAVFNSCVDKGDTKLRWEGLSSLCNKLQLEERSDELISCLSERKATFISFKTFRDGLLKLLGQTQTASRYLISKDTEDSSSHRHTAESSEYGHRSHVSPNENPKNTGGKVNGGMNGEIDHSNMCGLSGIGYPSVPKEMLEQIFEKLDTDCDGFISFDEFILLFETEKNTHEQSTLGWDNGSPSDVIKTRDSQSVVHILGPHQTGYARIGTIVSMWEIAGVSDAATLLSDLGFTSSEIRLTDLTTVLCDELKNLRDEPDNAVTVTHISLLKGALTLYQEEVRCMITLVENLSGERDKLRIDVAEANERANLLAQEIDEHHVRLEKSRQDQLKQLEQRHAEITKDLSIQCSTEREAHTAALKALDRQLQVVQHEEQQVRAQLVNVLRENQSLESEVETLTEQVSKLKSSNNQLSMQVQHLAAEHEEVETCDDDRESEEIMFLVNRIKRLQEEVALLRDQNDELTAEVEFVKNRSSESKSSEAGPSSLPNAPSEKLIKQRNESFEFAQISSNGWCKNVAIEVDDTKLSDLSNAIGSIVRELKSLLNTKTQCTSDYCAFRSNISNIITGLETNLSRVSVARMATDEINASSNNTKIENELEVECEERASESLRDLVVGQSDKARLVKRISQSDELINNIDKNFNNLDTKSVTKRKITSLRDYPPRKDDVSTSLEFSSRIDREKSNVTLNVTQSLNGVNSEENIRETLSELLKEQEAKHAMEKKQLADRCAELERSLDLLRTEYEQCEDYWAAKLEEERQLFEQEQKISDDKFTELIAKMAEYEEQFSPNDKARSDGRLSPIEEKFNLEEQYADLEEEFEELKTQTGKLLSQKDNEIRELQEKLSSERQSSESATSEASTQFPYDETEIECKAFTKLSSVATTNSNNDQQYSCSIAVINHPTASKKLLHYPANHRVFDPSKLNQIAESTVANNSLYTMPQPKIRDSYCQQIDAYTSMEELCRVHKAELHRLYQKKLEIDNECVNLTKQKDSLMKGVSELKNVTGISRFVPEGDPEDPCCININVLKALNERLQAQEKKRRNLKISLTHQQQHAERILQQTWQQHCQEVAALRFALQTTKEKLKLQVQASQEQAEHLAKADILSTDLYVQNAHLMASIKRLEQHCHMLAQFGGESTSV